MNVFSHMRRGNSRTRDFMLIGHQWFRPAPGPTSRRRAASPTVALERHRRAFTLLELMLAIAIFSGVLAAIYSSWTAVIRSSAVGQKVADDAQRLRISIRTLEDALVSVRLFPENGELYAFDASGEEGNQHLSLVARLPRSFPRSGKFGDEVVRRIEFRIEPDETTRVDNLVLRQQPILLDVDIDEAENPLILVRDISEFKMEFWGARSRDWEEEWVSTNQLPIKVRFSLALGTLQSQGKPAMRISRTVPILTQAMPRGVQGRPTPNPVLPIPTPDANPSDVPAG